MSNDSGYSGSQMLLAFLCGSAIGTVAALLLAPASGAETRQRLSASARQGRDRLTSIPPALRNAYLKASEAAREAFTEAYNKSLSDHQSLAEKKNG